MTDTEINIAIAESEGWTKIHQFGLNGEWVGTKDDKSVPTYIPDYCNDLNEMHSLIYYSGWLFSKRKAYQDHIQSIISEKTGTEYILAFSECLEATARQRAEAYLRTIKHHLSK